MVIVYILIILNIIASVFGFIGVFKKFKRVQFPESEKPPDKLQRGAVQFIEPISGKEKFNNAKKITDLLN
jgi:hypothetical protein